MHLCELNIWSLFGGCLLHSKLTKKWWLRCSTQKVAFIINDYFKNAHFDNVKVQIFWEGHKSLAHLPLFFWHYLIASNYKWKMGQIFVVFSENMNFRLPLTRCWCKNTHLASKSYGRIPKKISRSWVFDHVHLGIAIRSLSAFEEFYEGGS